MAAANEHKFMSNRLIIFIITQIITITVCDAYGYYKHPQRGYYPSNVISKKLHLVYSWKALDFAFPSDEARQLAIDKGEFAPGSPVPIDVDVARYGNGPPKIFVTIPRFQEGVPATLGYVQLNNNIPTNGDTNPLIVPYPNWQSNKIVAGNCNNLISVYRIKTDECGRLWVVDTGKLIENQICPPKLVIFELSTGKSSFYEFPLDQYKADSLFITPIVDIRNGQCANAFVYIADVSGFQLIVYDHASRKSWNIENNLFYPYPDYGSFTIDGQSFNLMDGIFGLALSPVMVNGDRLLFFHSLASVVEGYVPTSVIKNASLFEDHGMDYSVSKLFHTFKKTRQSQAGPQAMTENGVLIYSLVVDTAIGCWNGRDNPNFGGDNLDTLVVDRETLQFPSGLKVIKSGGREEVWTISVSFQRVMTGTLSPRVTNFRIQAGFIDELIQGTKCMQSLRY